MAVTAKAARGAARKPGGAVRRHAHISENVQRTECPEVRCIGASLYP